MLTRDELERLMAEYYTTDELCDLLEIESEELVDAFPDHIDRKLHVITERIEEDIGYDGSDEDD